MASRCGWEAKTGVLKQFVKWWISPLAENRMPSNLTIFLFFIPNTFWFQICRSCFLKREDLLLFCIVNYYVWAWSKQLNRRWWFSSESLSWASFTIFDMLFTEWLMLLIIVRLLANPVQYVSILVENVFNISPLPLCLLRSPSWIQGQLCWRPSCFHRRRSSWRLKNRTDWFNWLMNWLDTH